MKSVDLRFKIVLGLILIFLVATLQNDRSALFAFCLSTILVLISNPKVKSIFIRLLVVNSFILFLAPFLLFGIEGEYLFSFYKLEATREGALKIILILSKLNAIAFISSALYSHCNITEIGKALQSLKVSSKLTSMIFFTSRYLSTLQNEFSKIRESAKARGFRPRNNLHSYKTFAYMIGNLLLKSIDRSERIYQAMSARGFDGNFYTISFYTIRKRDYLFMILVISTICCIGWIEYVS